MPQKVKNSGKSEHFEIRGPTGAWTPQVFHGIEVYIDSKQAYRRFSPRQWAVACALRQFWTMNAGVQFPYRATMDNLRFFIRGTGQITLYDYGRAKEIIRELGSVYVKEATGETYVYASTRGNHAVSGFVLDHADAVDYEHKNHAMLQLMSDRISTGTVEPASALFGMPIRASKIKTKTL